MHEEHQNTPEQERATQFTQQLHSILYHPLTVETIDTFAEDALERLITLTEAVVDAFTRDFPESDQYAGRELEDKAYQAYGLENLNDIFDQIGSVRTNITQIKATLPQHIKAISTVITPPDASDRTVNGTGTGTYESPRLFNRVLTLAYILEHDFDIPLANTEYQAGSTTDSMMRQEPYVRVSIPDLNRVVYVCDEEGNASYIFDTKILEQLGVSIDDLDTSTKNQRNAFIRTTPTVGRRIIQSPGWRTVVANALETPFDEREIVEKSKTTQVASEFRKRERGPKLDFDIFIDEVRAAYTKDESPTHIQAWYQSEYKHHLGWPSNPHKMYKDDGWISYPAMVGNETKEHLSFDSFEIDVQKRFIQDKVTGGIHDWYLKTYKNQPGWPAAPNVYYKDKGWKNWESLIGREKIEFLTFEEFVTAIQEVYKTANRPQQIQAWYRKEQIKHPQWPARPDVVYKGKGWTTLKEVVGKDIKYREFIEQVSTKYKEAGEPDDIFNWYISVYKNYLGWPSKPHRTYKDIGWISYPAMVRNK